ncbi:MAG TPA: response regulator [Candidatus Wallbacteria bacterium]|nr:response regulator [Candidatus Wallbacteria bacterium]
MANIYSKYFGEKPQVAVIYLKPVISEECVRENIEYIVSEISESFEEIFKIQVKSLKGKKISDILSDPFSSYDYYHVISDAFSINGPETIDFYSELSKKNYSIQKNKRDNKEINITIVVMNKLLLGSELQMDQLNKYNLLFESMIDAIWECDIKGYIIGFDSINESGRPVNVSEIIGANIQQLLLARELKSFMDYIYRCTNEQVKTGKNFFINYSNEKKYHHAQTHIIPIYTYGGILTGFYGIIKKSEALLYNANEESNEFSEISDTCDQIGPVSYLSHEIRTPLNSILGFSKLLEIGEQLSGEQQNYISHIQNCSKHVLSVVNSILDLSKIENGSAELEYREFIINNVINDAIAIVAPGACEQNNPIIFDPSSFDGKKYFGDAGKFKQVIINLLGNASKFTNNGKITIELKSLSETLTDEEISVTVTDSGSGIAWDKIDNIFKPFFGSSQKMKNKNSGAGIGLPLSNAIVKLMGGSGISVESKIGVGSKFCFSLKLKKMEEKRFENNAENISRIGGPESKIKILIIEDDVTNSYLIGKIFELLNRFEYVVANNGTDALKLIASSDFDIILMDLNIPDINGIDITRIIRQSNIKVPIIAMTGDVTEQALNSCYDAGMNGFISKPFVVTELIHKIDDNLQRGKNNRINFSTFADKMVS